MNLKSHCGNLASEKLADKCETSPVLRDQPNRGLQAIIQKVKNNLQNPEGDNICSKPILDLPRTYSCILQLEKEITVIT